MRKIVTLVERGGRARSVKVENLNVATIREIVARNDDTKSTLATDEAQHYRKLGKEFAGHLTVNHSLGEYARRSDGAGINSAEGFFSIFKRGMIGVYQHCGEQHLHRYLAEFDFRYGNRMKLGVDDVARAMLALKGIAGKRLTCRRIGERA
jgi:hypothetical protein